MHWQKPIGPLARLPLYKMFPCFQITTLWINLLELINYVLMFSNFLVGIFHSWRQKKGEGMYNVLVQCTCTESFI